MTKKHRPEMYVACETVPLGPSFKETRDGKTDFVSPHEQAQRAIERAIDILVGKHFRWMEPVSISYSPPLYEKRTKSTELGDEGYNFCIVTVICRDAGPVNVGINRDEAVAMLGVVAGSLP